MHAIEEFTPAENLLCHFMLAPACCALSLSWFVQRLVHCVLLWTISAGLLPLWLYNGCGGMSYQTRGMWNLLHLISSTCLVQFRWGSKYRIKMCYDWV